ncbi:T9SS type A sorting domain-containing protein [Brumimicrobium mesophilum]|uniref:T9SS type A sorting domain-containing protein n=1 Tax=Brumimicrobium mesophilum TaxID=392717 RepID=UPI000D13FF96|nr:T9SS type A sorting domain-containing protein [Brumimicrobium mesophilum]
MNKTILLLLSTCSGMAFGQSYAPAAGEPNSTAIAFDDSKFVAWATNIEIERGYVNISDTSVYYDNSNKATFGEPSDAIGPATNNSTDVVSLGDKGVAIATFATPIANGTGPDFAIFENGFSDNFLELAHVEVSSDGINYFRFPSHSETQTENSIGGFGFLDPTYLYNLAGKYKVGYGTPFDLEELKDSIGLNVNSITHVKIIDVVGSIDEHGTKDSYGNKINDPFPTPYGSAGFDLNGIGVINEETLGLTKEEISFNLFPNPSNGIINIEFTGSNDMEVKIYNNTGQQIKQFVLNEINKSISLDLNKGVYFIHGSSQYRTNTQKIVIQ